MKDFLEVEHSGHIVGFDITIGADTIFLDIPVSLSIQEAREFIESIMKDDSLSVNEKGFITTSQGVVLQVGKILDGELSHTPAHTKISGEVNPNGRMIALRDNGTIGKSEWRFALLKYAKGIFPEGIKSGESIVFMPGMGRDEFNLWKSLGAHSRDMTLIEGDDKKILELQRKYQNNGSTPGYVNSYFGTGDETFSRELIEEINGRNIAVLSLDTESGLSPGLYRDLLGVISNINVKGELLFMLNVVGRGSTEFSRKFTSSEYEDDVISDALKKLPHQMLIDSERSDLEAVDIEVGSYLGGSSTTMHFVFAHIKNN